MLSMLATAKIMGNYHQRITIFVNDEDQDGRQRDDEITEKHRKLSDDVDSIMDEINEVLEESAEEFARSYVEKGGQGWSDFFTPEFYVGAATAGILGGVTYDGFRTAILRTVKSLRGARGGPDYDPLAQDIESEYYEETIKNAWKNANRLVKKQGIEHSIDEATALHWTLYIKELERSVGTVRLGRKRHRRLASAASREDLGPSQLAARIIDQWLKQQEK